MSAPTVESISSVLPLEYSNTLRFYLNGAPVAVTNPDPEQILIDYIRDSAFLYGTKLGCAEGGCGACTVTLAAVEGGKVVYRAVNLCIVPLIAVEGKHVITVEGIGQHTVPNPHHPTDESAALHPTQERIAKFHGLQCGFCTPGIVMLLYALLRNNPTPTKEQISTAFDGNLCRCTGYMPIIDAAFTFAKENQPARKVVEQVMAVKNSTPCAKGKDCCRVKGDECATSNPEFEIDMNALFTPNGEKFKPYDPLLDLAFPEPLRTQTAPAPLLYGNSHKVWMKPTNKEALLKAVAAYPQLKLVAGASEVQVEVALKNMRYPLNIYCNEVLELQHFTVTDTGVTFGANISLTNLELGCEELAHKVGPHAGQIYHTLVHQLKHFAGRQIRNAATPAGAIVTALPISDLNPVLVGARALLVCELWVDGKVVQQEFSLRDFFTGYRKTRLPPNHVVTLVTLPATLPLEYVVAYKQLKRKDDDIAIVTACLRVQLDPATHTVVDVCLAYGGMAAMTVTLPKTEAWLMGKPWTQETLDGALVVLAEEYTLPFGVPGGMALYRRTLTLSFFFRFFHYAAELHAVGEPSLLTGSSTDLGSDEPVSDSNLLAPTVLSALSVDDIVADVTRNKPVGHRDNINPYEERVVGKLHIHAAALKQVTGEAQYVLDIPPQHRELCCALVMSTKPHAKVLGVDYAPALAMETVVGYVDVRDLHDPLANYWGPNPAGRDTYFVEDEVRYVGDVIGCVYASDPRRAAEAARAVVVTYEELPAIISVEEAVAQDLFFDCPRLTEKGDWETALAGLEHVFENQCRFGAQEHFYFETQGCLVIPEEDGELKIYNLTQNPTECQETTAHVTGVLALRIVVRTKRLGGGFGGKELRPLAWAAYAALGARKFKRPVRLFLSRLDDMLLTGQRHPFLCKWRVGLDKNFRFTALDAQLYANAGWSMDLTHGVVERAVLHATNVYNIPHARVLGRPCKTNTALNTAFRGFGGPQGMYMMELIVQDCAERLGVDPEVIRDANYYTANAGQTTNFKQAVGDDYSVRELVAQNKEELNYEQLVADVEQFNAQHTWVKRGVYQMPTMFGILFGALFLNQAGALVHVHPDGLILVLHGGTEIGQGLNTKMIMIAAEEFGVLVELVYILETSTQVVANTLPTAALALLDLNGMAVQNACRQITERLAPVREQLGPDASFADVAKLAYFQRINLSANGHYKTPDIGFVWGDPDPKPAFFYYTQGLAVCVVEVDTLTGDWSCLEAHVKMDIGRPINQAIDYGQIEGAFVQGMGLFTMEQSLWVRRLGALFTRGPGAYKIPGFRDVPQKFNILMLKDRDFAHLKTVRRLKGIGEPPLFLGACVHFALRQAVAAARRQHGLEEGMRGQPFMLPMTTERIRNFVGDPLAARGLVVAKEGEEDFFVEA